MPELETAVRMNELASLPLPEIREVAALINLANADRREPFEGDRIRGDDWIDLYPDATAIRIFEGRDLIGTVSVVRQEPNLWIYLLAISPRRRRGGLGVRLLSIAEGLGRNAGLQCLRLEAVDSGNLIPYYLSLGFCEVGRETKPAGHWRAIRPFELVTLEKPI